jgi:hypothetical protein
MSAADVAEILEYAGGLPTGVEISGECVGKLWYATGMIDVWNVVSGGGYNHRKDGELVVKLVGFARRANIKFVIVEGEFEPWVSVEVRRILTGCTHLESLSLAMRGDTATDRCSMLNRIIRNNTKLRGFRSHPEIAPDDQDQRELCAVLAEHPSLRRFDYGAPMFSRVVTFKILIELIRRNRVIREYETFGDHTSNLGDTTVAELCNAIRDNWQLVFFRAGTPQLQIRLNNIMASNEKWIGIHAALRSHVADLLPLRLPTYVMLWILDWLPPINRRYNWRGDPSYDPYHGKKVALIEGLTHSYRAIKG